MILQNKELLPELTVYGEIWEILTREVIDGHRMTEQLKKACQRADLVPQKGEIEQIMAYKENHGMQRKWKRYLNLTQKKNPQWEEVLSQMEIFYGAVWEAILADTIFLGDWMPELGRYLD